MRQTPFVGKGGKEIKWKRKGKKITGENEIKRINTAKWNDKRGKYKQGEEQIQFWDSDWISAKNVLLASDWLKGRQYQINGETMDGKMARPNTWILINGC